MPTLIVLSRQALVGKTAVAVGLARSLADAGRRPSLARVAPSDTDTGAQSDARCFASLALSMEGKERPLSLDKAVELAKASRPQNDTLIMEMPAGSPTAEAARALNGVAVLVERFPTLAVGEAASVQRELGDAFAGIVVTAVPQARIGPTADKLAAEGLSCLALLPEDKLLASPSIGEISEALEADLLFANGHTEDVVEHLTVASIAADPGQEYFARFGRQAVVVRHDKPDLQIAALNAGVQCLILTGGEAGAPQSELLRPHGTPLPYVSQRAEEERIPLLVTHKETLPTIQALEDLYVRSRFRGHRKAERIGELMAAHLDGNALLGALGISPKRG
jgi:BioD-like phosphotransacetylase family protein